MTVDTTGAMHLLVPAVLLIAACLDVRSYRVPNVLNASLLAFGLGLRFWAGGLAGLGEGLFGAVAGFAVLVGFYAIGVMGAGDVKLGAAVGACLGADETLRALLIAALAGGVYVLAVRALTGGLRSMLGLLFTAAHDPLFLLPERRGGDVLTARLGSADRRRHLVPFAAMMAVGVLVTAAGGWGNR